MDGIFECTPSTHEQTESPCLGRVLRMLSIMSILLSIYQPRGSLNAPPPHAMHVPPMLACPSYVRMPPLPAAVAVKDTPAQGSLFGDHVLDLLTAEEVADPATVLRADACIFSLLVVLHAPPERIQATAEALDMQPATVNQALLASLYLWARRQGELVAASFQAQNLRAALTSLGMDNDRVSKTHRGCSCRPSFFCGILTSI